MAQEKESGAYVRHAALNLGQAARDVRYLGDHPDADKVAPKGSAHHIAASVTSRLPSLASNLYYAALPPSLHHTPEELAGVNAATAKEWFLSGYKPWEHGISDDRVDAAVDAWKEKEVPNKALEMGVPQGKEAVASVKEAFKLQGHTNFQGLPIAIENRKGSVRSGVDDDGRPWRTEMKHPYGFLKKTKGADGEEVDCYVGPKKDATHAHVVHQKKDDGRTYDEDKVMLGFSSKEQATKAFLAHYDSPKFLGPVKEVPMDRLKTLLDGDKPLRKIAVPWFSFSDELAKLAAEAANVGQWWEQVGGPFLAKGGSHGEFKKMMKDAKIPPRMQDKFTAVAKEKYPAGKGMLSKAWNKAKSTVTGDGGPGGGHGTYSHAKWEASEMAKDYERAKQHYADTFGHEAPAVSAAPYPEAPAAMRDMGDRIKRQREARERRTAQGAANADVRAAREAHERAQAAPSRILSGGIQSGVNKAGLAAALAAGGYLALAPKSEDPDTDYARWKGRLGAHLQTTAPLALAGLGVGSMMGSPKAQALGALGGGALGAGLSELGFHMGEEDAHARGARAVNQSARIQKDIRTEAGRTSASHGLDSAVTALGPALLAFGHTQGLGGTVAGATGISAVGGGMRGKYLASHTNQTMKGKLDAKQDEEYPHLKAASGAPGVTGNFNQASDIPAFRYPRLDRALQKDGDFADGFTYSPGDFRKVDPMRKRANLAEVADVFLRRKEAALMTPSSGQPLGATRVAGAAGQAKQVGAPRVTTPSGPSIAQQSKPSGYGVPAAGAIKGGI